MRRPSRCHYGKGAETRTQLWAAWPGCLLSDPHQGHQELAQHHPLGAWGGAPCTSGVSHCWRRNDIFPSSGWSLFLWEIWRLYPCALWKVCSVEGVLSFHPAGCWVLQKLPLGTWDVQGSGSHLLSLPWMGLGCIPRGVLVLQLGVNSAVGAGAGWRGSSVLPRRSVKSPGVAFPEQLDRHLFY